MEIRRGLWGAGACLALLTSAMGAGCATMSQGAATSQAAAKPDAPKKPDAGKFSFTLQGAKVGSNTFKFDADGGSEANAEVEVGGQSQKFKVTVQAKDGKTLGFAASAGEANRFTATIAGTQAKVSINGGPAMTQSVPAGAIPFGNFSPHLMNGVMAAYDVKKGGAQPITLILAEGLPNGQIVTVKGKLTAKGAKEMTIAGKAQPVSVYSLMIDAGGQQVEMKLYANADRRLLAWDVPSQSYTAVREGYEDVLKAVGK